MGAQAILIGTGAPVIIGNAGIGNKHHVVYFPESFNFKKSQDIAEIKVPGLNHPVIQYIAGSSLKFTVDLLLYGYDSNPPVTITNELQAMMEWVMTSNAGTDSRPGELPPLVSVGFGPAFNSIECFCTDMDIKVTMVREEDLEPIEAECRLEFTEYVPFGLSAGGGIGLVRSAPKKAISASNARDREEGRKAHQIEARDITSDKRVRAGFGDLHLYEERGVPIAPSLDTTRKPGFGDLKVLERGK